MLERRRSAESIGLELAALRIEHTLQANLITRLADALYLAPDERHMLDLLQAEQQEMSAWAASLKPPSTPSGGS